MPLRAGGHCTAPDDRLNRAACHGHVTSSPATDPSHSGAPRCGHVSSMARNVPSMLNRAMTLLPTFTCLLLPDGTSCTVATFTNAMNQSSLNRVTNPRLVTITGNPRRLQILGKQTSRV